MSRKRRRESAAAADPPAVTADSPASVPVPGAARRLERVGLVVALVLGTLVFANALGGAFVYDDLNQIVRNEYIQENRYLWKALTSDVWAFRTGQNGPLTGYWRPVFVLWLVANERLFGTANAAGWHVTSLLAHLAAIAACAALLRRLRVEPLAQGVILALFAVHPVHVESVAWVSGVTDPLATALLVAAWSFHLESTRSRRAVALVLYVLALMTKEFTVVLPALVFAGAWLLPPRKDLREAAREAAPYAGAAFVFLVARAVALGSAGLSPRFPGQATPVEMLLSLPAVAAFYLRETLVPFALGPMHPLRAVRPGTLGAVTFVIPLVAVGGAAWLLWLLARKEPSRRLGLLVFALPLVPAMKIDAFHPEQIVQDRYLYLPLLGMLLVLVPAASEGLGRWLGPSRGRQALLGLAGTVGLALGLETAAYAQSWGSVGSFWERAVAADPRSTVALVGHATVLRDSGRAREALAEVERALEVAPAVKAHEMRGQLLVDLGRVEEGEKELLLAAENDKISAGPYERLAIAYQQGGRLDQAERILRLGRERLPSRFATLTDSLSIVLYLQGRKADALAELEAVRERALRETGAQGPSVLLHLGSLYAEVGRTAEARRALEEYLTRTERLQGEPEVVEQRGQARKALASLPPS